MRIRQLGRPALIVAALALAILVSGASSTASAQGEVTFTKDVAPILYENCVSCHRPGELAPMALRTYAEVRPWARLVKEQVVGRKMPPFFSDARHGYFKNDTRLMQSEVDTIAQWVDAGAPQGDPNLLPEVPTFTDGWQLGEPDMIVTFPLVEVPATGDDYYPDLTLTLDLPEKRWIRAIEVRPSNRKVTHHQVIFTSSGGGVQTASTESGFFDVLAVWSVGTNPHVFPEGMGRWVYPDQQWTINAHYHPSGTAESDQTEAGLYFGEGEMQKEVMAAIAGSMSFEIPPNTANHEIRASYIIDQDISVLSFFPHMHVRGQAMDLIANYPNGESQSLINVPEYDFDWQLFYYPEKYVPLPAGTRLDVVANFDNSVANPDNPDPDKAVGFGLQTTDEMVFNVFEFIADEGVSPKPANDETRRDALLSSLPTGSAFSVGLPMMGNAIPTALHLPKNGEGMWYIPMQGQLLSIPAENLAWDDNAFNFDMKLRLGPIKSDFAVTGTVDADGAIQGTFEVQGNGISPFQGFDGTLAGAGN
jgi:mono/diheme cytochrome c family protein